MSPAGWGRASLEVRCLAAGVAIIKDENAKTAEKRLIREPNIMAVGWNSVLK